MQQIVNDIVHLLLAELSMSLDGAIILNISFVEVM